MSKHQTEGANALLLTPEAAADQLGLSRSHVYRMLAEGQLPSIKIGRLRRIPLEALKRWIADQQVAAG